jgi:GNAT superfamily N-acetyltransferase
VLLNGLFAVVSLSLSDAPPSGDGIRPVNLRTDLAALADLIELAFSETMDNNGRAAVREMRSLSRVRPPLQYLLGVHDIMQGIHLGYVWIADGRLVGNVSIYPAETPAHLGKTWIIANVAVHPDYRGRGIARQLMQCAMTTIRPRGERAILQVDASNGIARGLYESLGFVREGEWTHWRRSSTLRIPPPLPSEGFRITQRRDEEWQAEYRLATQVRSTERGGLGWQRPLDKGLFHYSLLKRLNNALSFRSIERLIIRSADEKELMASLWIENAFGGGSSQLTLLVHPDYAGLYDEALLNLAIRRFGSRNPITIEHPSDDDMTRLLLLRFGFHTQRSLVHMHWHVH